MEKLIPFLQQLLTYRVQTFTPEDTMGSSESKCGCLLGWCPPCLC